MNSNLNRALASGLAAFGAVAPALAQFDWDGHCISTTTTAPYSTDYLAYRLQTDLFGAGIGVSGTVDNNRCGGGSAPVVGRIGFTVGPSGSAQDSDPQQDFGGLTDDMLRLTDGTNWAQETVPNQSYTFPFLSPSVGGLSYARIFVRNADGTLADANGYLYGSNGIRLGFIGRSGRYIYTESTVDGTDTNNSVYVRCIIDVLADAGRVTWHMENRLNLNTNNAVGVNVGLGLWFGQSIRLVDQFKVERTVQYGSGENSFPSTYITIPGRRPLSVQERFPGDVTTTVPPYVNFSMNQLAGFGLQVVNSPSALGSFDPQSVSDQTQVDEFVVGEAPFLISGVRTDTNPVFGDFIFNPVGNGNADAAALQAPVAYIQKWQPTTIVGPRGSRDIVAYYRSTSGDSSYGTSFTGYSAVVDAPKSISTISSDPSGFTPNPFHIRVNVDNTGGFSISDQAISMQSVEVVLNLPAGMHAPNSTARTITRVINNVGPAAIGAIDFEVEIDPTAYGSLPYTVSIEPQPGFQKKFINGVINVATTPRLLVRSGANLLSPPWQFADSSWDSVLDLDINGDFTTFTWDATTQSYVPQVGAERGRGTWVLSNSDLGFRALGGTPMQPDDQFPDPDNIDVGGAPLIRLHRGWNLVGNPYNYSFDIGQLVGVPVGQTIALQYNNLVSQGYTDGAFTAFDPSTRTYVTPVQGAGSRLQPNSGYWLYANLDFDLVFPPLYDLFIRSAAPSTTKQRFDDWKLQLSAATSYAADVANYVGVVRKTADVAGATLRKAPLSPSSSAVRAYVVGNDRQWGYQQAVRTGTGKQTYAYNVYASQAGPVTVSWPNLKSIPSNLAVSIKDNVTGKTINARSTSGYTYTSAAKTERGFTITVTPQGTVAQRVGSATSSVSKTGPIQMMKVQYSLSGRGAATIRVYKGKTLVAVAANDIDATSGVNTVLWPQTDLNGQPLAAGSYTMEIAATGEGGDTATRQFAVTVRR